MQNKQGDRGVNRGLKVGRDIQELGHEGVVPGKNIPTMPSTFLHKASTKVMTAISNMKTSRF